MLVVWDLQNFCGPDSEMLTGNTREPVGFSLNPKTSGEGGRWNHRWRVWGLKAPAKTVCVASLTHFYEKFRTIKIILLRF